MLKKILEIFENSSAFRTALQRSSNQQHLNITGLAGSARSFFIYNWIKHFPGVYLILTPTEKHAFAIKNDLNEISSDSLAYQFPEWSVKPYQWKTPPGDRIGERLEALYNIHTKNTVIITASIKAALEHTISPENLNTNSLQVTLNQEIALDDILQRLTYMGYENSPMVEEVGSYSVRGGIVDIFPHSTENPIRIEFFGDFIESIRTFSVSSQRSIAKLDKIILLPRREIMLSNTEIDEHLEKLSEKDREILSDKFRFGIDNPGLEWAYAFFNEHKHYLFDYLPENSRLYLMDSQLIETECDNLDEQYHNLYEQEKSKYDSLPPPQSIYLNCSDFNKNISEYKKISELSLGEKSPDTVNFGMIDHPVINSQIKLLKDHINSRHSKNVSIFLACDNKVQKDRMTDILEDDAEKVTLGILDIAKGFYFPDENLEMLTDHQIFTRSFHRYRKSKIKEGVAISSYTNLSMGDYVVHVDYGIGRYRGLAELIIDNRRRDCLLITYERDDKLYVPIEEFNRVQKYIGKDGRPRLSVLGGTGWQKVKARTKKAITKMAEELLRLYAERKAKPGYVFSPDSTWMSQLEASFPYDETPDQLEAIGAVKKDMQSEFPADRLICGDVGFGKTEVAIRAAFKAVCDDKQVAVLVPTTILAQQHQTTFRERLADFPLRIEMLSRFKTRKEQKEIVKELQEGKIDIIIGTHRLLSKDVEIPNLGLLVVDEEQRFGVAHKEKIKQMRRMVDVITMTATPIPRTMQMSLLGARDMSIINTSPKDRLPIDTEICEFNPDSIRRAILDEIERGGQVYFVHNRIQSILSIHRYLSKLLPHIRIAVAHGQMPEKELEEIMISFWAKQYDVLLSTSIIESGLDIPLVNTIIINRADRFGLAQLYQLRGRVGRSARRARAILLIPPLRIISTTARKRLKALEQHTELGSGFHLAMKDLEIRGAGNLLGPQQHGFIEEVGFDLYLKLLKEAVAELKGEKTKEIPVVKIDTDLELYFPNDYVPHSQQKVELYQKLAQSENYEDLNDLKLEVIDRFGQLPSEGSNLFEMSEIKLLAAKAGIIKIVMKKDKLTLDYSPDKLPSKKTIARLTEKISLPLEFNASENFSIFVDFQSLNDDEKIQNTKIVLQLLAK